MEEEINTEQRIKEAARRVFVRKGLKGARMQEIADEANINKAMLHYYYRSKEKLFKNIFEEVIEEFAPKIISILGEDKPLEKKIETFVDHYLNLLTANPFLPLFFFSELRNHPDYLIEKIGIKRTGVLKRLSKQLEEEAKAGNIRSITTIHFVVNLMSMSIFPFIAQPMLQGVFDMNNEGFGKFIDERKKIIPEFIMSAITINDTKSP